MGKISKAFFDAAGLAKESAKMSKKIMVAGGSKALSTPSRTKHWWRGKDFDTARKYIKSVNDKK